MAKLTDLKPLSPELSKKLQEIATTQNVTIISFIAPHGVRTSPVTFASASIEENELYRLEKIVEKATANKTKALHFIIHTPGGDMHASYKIARFLRNKFNKISAFVPYEAASGGTILCCAANEVYMSDMANLTSFDPHVRYKDTRVAAQAFIRAANYIEENYGEMSPEEMPSPWQQMANKLDPVIYDQMNTALFTSKVCVVRLLKKSGYGEKVVDIANRLGNNMYTHEFPLFSEDAKEIGFNVREEGKELMNVYRELVTFRSKESFPTHAIDSFYPEIVSTLAPEIEKDMKGESKKNSNENKKPRNTKK